MELVLVLMVAQEEDIADERIKRVAHLCVVLLQSVAACLGVEVSLHLALCVELRLHLVAVVMCVVEECLTHISTLLAEPSVQHPVCYERLCHESLVPV